MSFLGVIKEYPFSTFLVAMFEILVGASFGLHNPNGPNIPPK